MFLKFSEEGVTYYPAIDGIREDDLNDTDSIKSVQTLSPLPPAVNSKYIYPYL